MNCRRFLALLAGLPALGLGLAHAQQETPSQLMRRAVDAFFAANMRESVELFDQLLKLEPALKPELWQRGLALYLAGDYQAGRDQFEVHQGFNSHDVENAVWHFLCVARLDGVDKARQALIPIEGDSRVPMREVYELFAGRGSVKARQPSAISSAMRTSTLGSITRPSASRPRPASTCSRRHRITAWSITWAAARRFMCACGDGTNHRRLRARLRQNPWR